MPNRTDLPPDPFISKILSEELGNRHPRRLESNRMISGTEIQERMTVRVFSSVNIVTPGVGAFTLSWDSETFDQYGFHDPAVNPSRLTVPGMVGGGSKTTGLWLIHTTIKWASTNGDQKQLLINKNGATIANKELPGIVTAFHWSDDLYVYDRHPVAGDYYEVAVVGTGDTLVGGNQNLYFEILHVW